MEIDVIKVRFLHAQRGLTQQQLAERAGISNTGLAMVLKRGSCQPGTILRIARALGVTPRAILKEV